MERKEKVDKLIELANKTDEEVEKMSFKEKQQYYKAKSKLGTIIFKSKDEDGNGRTYKKMPIPNQML